jgi:type II secretory pathway pseudopilin PulG
MSSLPSRLDRQTGHQGFTILEVLAALLLFTFGILSTIALTMRALTISYQAQSQSTGMATALTALYDASPGGRPPDTTSDWVTDSVIGMPGPSGNYSVQVKGYLNGLYVSREEYSTTADVIDEKSRWVFVKVHVWIAQNGDEVTTVNGQFLREWP